MGWSVSVCGSGSGTGAEIFRVGVVPSAWCVRYNVFPIPIIFVVIISIISVSFSRFTVGSRPHAFYTFV